MAVVRTGASDCLDDRLWNDVSEMTCNVNSLMHLLTLPADHCTAARGPVKFLSPICDCVRSCVDCVLCLVWATTAANSRESSYACYYDSRRQTYLGDVYSVNWMEDSDKVRHPYAANDDGHQDNISLLFFNWFPAVNACLIGFNSCWPQLGWRHGQLLRPYQGRLTPWITGALGASSTSTGQSYQWWGSLPYWATTAVRHCPE